MAAREVPTEPPTAGDIEQLPEILTREQAAWLLRLTVGRLDEAAKRGEIPCSKVGRRRLYSKTALLEFVRGQ